MQAYVISEAGGPEKLILKNIPKPEVRPGSVLIQVKAIGINRSEYFTRIGQSPSVIFPRVLGIECVGTIAESRDGEFWAGQKVAAIMGGMGREFDGSYAEYVLVPKQNVFAVDTSLDWKVFGALPEMIQTTHGSLVQGLNIQSGQTLLIRGGTSTIGLCALALAKNAGLKVISTTRSLAKADFLKSLGADEVRVEHAALSREIRESVPEGIDAVLELIGTKSLIDSLRCVRRGGTVCMTGILGGEWELKNFAPMGDIPTAVKLTSYSGDSTDLTSELLQKYVNLVETGNLKIQLAETFSFDHLPDAHRLMDSNQSNGKIVVLV